LEVFRIALKIHIFVKKASNARKENDDEFSEQDDD